MEVRGHVTLNHRPVSSNIEIPENAQIATGPDGFALISVVPGSAVQIRANSTLDLGRTPDKGVSVNLHIGGIWSLLPHGSNYEVVTSAATASVRGTQFYVHVDKRKGTDICACDGDVHMQTFDGKAFNQVITSPNHDHHAYHFAKKRKKVVVKHRPNPAHTMEGEEDLVHAAESSRE